MSAADQMKQAYSIVSIAEKDKPIVAEFLRKFFFRDEPLNVAIKLLDETESTNKLEKYCIDYLHHGFSFKAVSAAGDLIGVILNNVMEREENEQNGQDEEESSPNCKKFKDIIVLLDKIKREADVFKLYPHVKRILEIKIVTVNDANRGQGVCKALIDKTKELAKELDCQMIYVECTSHYSAKAVTRLGFKSIHSLEYQKHLNGQGEVVFETNLPHDRAEVFVLPIL
ncbi:arylalkylamine N-acetyltransferase 1-like isoform X2 [Adelges cooleyi]|nr:arylalkylamine N-acetyltransferase 1-like isoform X2 [Adelges cooleyi]XP_050433448.1 arylalkylamine N-acetyltransferase 1-like isoform X2 [Adelges cooleyi]XP_050433449.1 arylalkylamine N-acetyltransferase 1-like isoform X2 [Adelges cooleyi]